MAKKKPSKAMMKKMGAAVSSAAAFVADEAKLVAEQVGLKKKKKKKVNKSAAIREALTAHKDKGPKEIVEILAKQGVKATPIYVSTIKSNMNKKKDKRGRKAGKSSRNGHGTIDVANLQLTKQFVATVGGGDAAKELIDVLELLTA